MTFLIAAANSPFISEMQVNGLGGRSRFAALLNATVSIEEQRWPARNSPMCRKHVLMSLLALGWVPANLCWSQTDPVSPPPPQVELQAHGVDGVDLLRAIAEVTPFNLLAVREGHPARIDIPAHAAPMEGVWADI